MAAGIGTSHHVTLPETSTRYGYGQWCTEDALPGLVTASSLKNTITTATIDLFTRLNGISVIMAEAVMMGQGRGELPPDTEISPDSR